MNAADFIGKGDALHELHAALVGLRHEVERGAQRRLAQFAQDFPKDQPSASAWNLAHYLALRSFDLRPLQAALARNGLSSLGRIEAHVMANLNQVIRVLDRLCDVDTPEPAPAPVSFEQGDRTLATNALNLFGTAPSARDVRIMVTLPSEAASNEDLVRSLVGSGMDCARINCAHDGPEDWSRMIDNLRKAEAFTGRRCRVLMDLAGHKIRTGPLARLPAVTHVKPRRNLLGRTVEAAVIALLPEGGDPLVTPPAGIRHHLFGAPETLAALQPGDRLAFEDTRGKDRHLDVVRPLEGGGWVLHCAKGSYIGDDTVMAQQRLDASEQWRTLAQDLRFGGHAQEMVDIRLFKGDWLRLTDGSRPGEPARLDADGNLLEPAHVGVLTPEIFEHLRPGQPVWIDDGKAGAAIESVDGRSALLHITHCRPQGFRLREDKGLNFPGADLRLGPLSARDLADLDFVACHADMVGFSFVETRDDMRRLMDELARREASQLAIVAKIETQSAVQNLPEIILGTIGRHPLGIMIARGDLAVELGAERLAEIQEELLWLCEAAHVPVIWATQVLETMARTGAVSRPELTDAAMSGRAECVMLNKGPYILNALRSLDDILRRMQDHQHKKMAQLRALRLVGPR
ncbi:MAG: pyruvate kinase [Ectothiorhodospiraceae bacterium]|jgi:pyruvate kinase|nr:pyruvate kinase [Ectothiorhodospiraceae bacterium]